MKKAVFIFSFVFIILLNFIFASVVINEFAVDSQNDRDGDLIVSSNDEYFELYNSGSSDLNLNGWSLLLIDTTNETHVITGTIPTKGYFTILNPAGTQNNDGQIILVHSNGTIIDRVSYGSYNDGNLSDNAPRGNSSNNFNECLARIPNGKDTNLDVNDFIKTACTFNNTNNFVLINNEINVSCAFENENVKLSADVNATNISSVVFSYNVNGTNKNASGKLSLGSLVSYEYVINSSELVGGNVTWNVYLNDDFGNIFKNGIKTFYVRNKTDLIINPPNPDGDNGWYVSEPLFSLISDFSAIRKYYRWDSIFDILYTNPFNLSEAPNGAISGGHLDINYYSEFNCDSIINETNQKQRIKVDLVNPVFKNLNPANGSIVSEVKNISVFLDEIYNSNSGINKESVYMRIDGNVSNASISFTDFGDLDVFISHTLGNLSNGIHSIMVYAEDFSGRNSIVSWSFEVNNSDNPINLIFNSPQNISYNSRRVLFNLSTDKIVDSIEFINYNDKSPKWRILCKNCNGYGDDKLRVENFNEGENFVSVRAINGSNIKFKNVSFFIDSKKPKIIKTFPFKNFATNGSNFYVEFIENNLKEVSLSFNPIEILNLTQCFELRKNKVCSVNLNLSSFDGEKINYIFNVSDSLNSVISKEVEVFVDTKSPILILNAPQNISYDGKVFFNITISEKVILEYYDEFEKKWKRLCNNCDKYGADKIVKKNFKPGEYKLNIRAVDSAGNSDEEVVNFVNI